MNMSLSKFIKRFVIGFAIAFGIALVGGGGFLKVRYFHHKLPTKAVKLEDVKGVYILNMDRSTDRRAVYEKMLREHFGNNFLGKNIGEEIRLQNIVDGKKEIIFENVETGQKVNFQQTSKNGNKFIENGTWKVYTKKDPQVYFYVKMDETQQKYAKMEYLKMNEEQKKKNWYAGIINFEKGRIYSTGGNFLSFLHAFEKIANQPDGTYGIVFEDDFFVDKNFYKKLQNALSEAPENADLLKLSVSQLNYYKNKSKRIPRTRENIKVMLNSFKKYGYGSYVKTAKFNTDFILSSVCYVVSKKGAQKILDWYKDKKSAHFAPISDIQLNFFMAHNNPDFMSYQYINKVPVLLQDNAEQTTTLY